MRLVIPLIAGIILSDTIGNTRIKVSLLCALALAAVITTFTTFIFGGRLFRMFGFSLSLSFFIAGMFMYTIFQKRVHVDWPDEARTHAAVLSDYPYERERSYRLELSLFDSVSADIYLYVPKDSAVKALVPGNVILFNGRIESPRSEDGSDFDYARYLYRHGISGTLWVPSDNWRKLDMNVGGFHTRTLVFRRKLLEKYREWGLTGNALAVTAAVSLGSKREIDSGLREVWSTTGASHVLAVSGLHVGIMCAFLYFLLPAALFRRRTMWVRELTVLGIMWAYALLIGLPLSITRSLIMFSMLAFCRVTGRDSQPVNTLSFAALAILTASPESLFDISFQLSFCAVLAIVLFEPGIERLFTPRSAVGRYVWGIIAVSLAAQLGTAPIVMFSFSNFSTYFLLTNIIVIPIMFVVVCLSMVLLMTCWLPAVRGCVVWLLTGLVNLVNGALERIALLPHSSLTVHIDNAWQVWMAYAVIILVSLWLKERRTHRLVQALFCIALSLLASTLQNFAVLT